MATLIQQEREKRMSENKESKNRESENKESENKESEKKLPPEFDWRAFTPEDSPKTPLDVLADPEHQALATAEVKEGGPAHDFTCPVFDFSNGHKVITGRRFSLFDAAREKPVALIFGSYT